MLRNTLAREQTEVLPLCHWRQKSNQTRGAGEEKKYTKNLMPFEAFAFAFLRLSRLSTENDSLFLKFVSFCTKLKADTMLEDQGSFENIPKLHGIGIQKKREPTASS